MDEKKERRIERECQTGWLMTARESLTYYYARCDTKRQYTSLDGF